MRRRLLVEQVEHVQLEPQPLSLPISAELVRDEQVGARQDGVRPMSPRPFTSTGMVLVVLTTVLIGVPLPA